MKPLGSDLTRKEMLVFQQPVLTDTEITEVVDSLKNGWLSTGPKVQKFRQAFLEYKGASFGLPLNSCTSALFLSLKLLNIGDGDEVITTPMTFGATANVIEQTGAQTVFADCDRHTLNILPEEIAKKITSKTKAVIVVHFAGRPCDMDVIMEICKRYGLYLIEDCAHAVETEYKGQPVGTFGDFGCFSFYVTKNLFMGDGGFLLIKNENHFERASTLSNQGMSHDAWQRYSDKGFKHYKIIEPGFKMNMMDLQASLGIHQLKNINQNWKKRQAIWNFYNDELEGYPCHTPLDTAGLKIKLGYHLYTVQLKLNQLNCTRDGFTLAMQSENIGVGIHYIPLHCHPYYRDKYGFQNSSFPNANWVGERTLSLNIKPSLTKTEMGQVVTVFKKICNHYKK